jgi:uncharacterized membrane protein YphA (DoxX/SURF4 family)
MHLAQQRAADSVGAPVSSFDRALKLYARVALGASFLCAIGSRFGWWGPNVGWGNFENFTAYTAKVNSFMPAATIPFLAWAATVAEFSLGVALIFGLWLRWTALAAAVLLLIFASAMAISFGIKEPLDYSVFSASACALLLWRFAANEDSGGTK